MTDDTPKPGEPQLEADEAEPGADRESALHLYPGEVDEVDEPASDDAAPALSPDTSEVAEGDEPEPTDEVAESDGPEDEGWVEDDDEGRYDAPPLPPLLILAVVGLLAGFVTLGLVWLSEQGCDRVRDSPNCGAAGFPLLVVAVVITVVLGALALSRLAMPHPKLVAFLGVGFMLLIVLAFLSNDLFSTWTLLVVPVLTAITFLVAHLIAGRLERADA